VEFLALKKTGFSEIKNSSQKKKKKKILPFFHATFQCGRYNVSKKKTQPTAQNRFLIS
jgi:hypothetical protein